MRLVRGRFSDFLIVLILVAVVSGVSWALVNNPLGFSRLLFFVQVPFSQFSISCSNDSPEWLKSVQKKGSVALKALSGQVAYIEPEGQLHHCEMGWKYGFWSGRAVSDVDRYRYASVTKVVTSIAILDLINRGKLSLDSELTEILGLEGNFFDPRVEKITVQDLLTHRAGWDREKTQDLMFMAKKKPWCPSMPHKIRDTSLQFDPGSNVSYSNLGYCLLGLVVEAVTEQEFRAYIAGKFDFKSKLFRFIDGPFYEDEVTYDMRHENFFTNNYISLFDFYSLSSSVGLSGNASELAILVKESLEWSPLNILKGGSAERCDKAELQECYGFGLYKFQAQPESIPLFIQGGKLPGTTSAVIVDKKGGVFIWLGAGAPNDGGESLKQFYSFVAESLTEFYD